jgi:hypothetical protein
MTIQEAFAWAEENLTNWNGELYLNLEGSFGGSDWYVNELGQTVGLDVWKNSAQEWRRFFDSVKDEYPTPTSYFDIFMDNDLPVIQYWFFYPFNDSHGDDHEGDWEHINVKITSQDPQLAEGLQVAYYFHGQQYIADWSSINRTESHPHVYVGGDVEDIPSFAQAPGEITGGSFPGPCRFHNTTPLPLFPDGDEVIITGRVIDYSQITLINITTPSDMWWGTFPGKWGVPDFLVQPDGPSTGVNINGAMGPWTKGSWKNWSSTPVWDDEITDCPQ